MEYVSIPQQIKTYMQLQKLPPHARQSKVAFDRMAARMKADQMRRRAIDELIELESDCDPIDARLRAIVAANKVGPITLGGVAGGMQMVNKMFDPNNFKAKAAERLLMLRQVRRWHKYHKGIAFTSQNYLDDAAAFRIRATRLTGEK